MKKLLILSTALALSAFASAATAETTEPLKIIDGCTYHKNKGANYNNLDDPRCGIKPGERRDKDQSNAPPAAPENQESGELPDTH